MFEMFNSLNWINLLCAIPIVAIVGGIGSEIIGKVLKHRERIAEIKAKAQSRSVGAPPASVDALREEVALLRDTCTRFDLSLQHSLEELQHRVDFLESRYNQNSSHSPVRPVQQDEAVTIAGRTS